MDAFYASVEQLDHPEWRGKPLVVGGNAARGVVAAASYEARKYGIHSAMSSVLAARKCPHLIFAPHRFDRYRELSRQIREIFFEYTDLVEPLSLDEAFLDVTENKMGLKSAILIARQIRQKIKEKTGLNASAGVSYNKFLAKIASDLNKPNGQAVILPEEAQEFLENLPIKKFFGIGKVTAEKNGKARDIQWQRSQGIFPPIPHQEIWQVRPSLLQYRAGNSPVGGSASPSPKESQCRKHLRKGHHQPSGNGNGIEINFRGGNQANPKKEESKAER